MNQAKICNLDYMFIYNKVNIIKKKTYYIQKNLLCCLHFLKTVRLALLKFKNLKKILSLSFY